MRGIWNRTIVGLFLLISATWAADPGASSELLSDDVDTLLNGRQLVLADALAPESGGTHSMMWGDDPDWLLIAAGVWWGELTGPIRVEGEKKVDVSSTLGLDNRVGIPFVRAGLRLWRFEFILEGWWWASDGSAVVQEDFEIDGIVFEIDDVIDSRMTLNSYRVALGFEFWQSDPITCAFVLGVFFLNTTGSIQTEGASARAHWNEWLPVPTIGINIAGDFDDRWLYEFELNWIGFSNQAFALAAVDVRLAVGYQIKDWLLARIGYRFMTLSGRVDIVELDFEIEGFYLEFALSF